MEGFLTASFFGFNWVDIVFVLILIYFVATSRGFIDTIFEVVGFLLSLTLSYKLYALTGHLLFNLFHLSNGIANALGFFVTWFVCEAVIFFLIAMALSYVGNDIRKNPVNIAFGYVASIMQGTVIFLFIIALIFAFPTRGQVKQSILDSHTGPYFVEASQSFEKSLKSVFGEAISETINFLTIKPDSESTLDLGFKLKQNQLSTDTSSEEIMFQKVNEERKKRGVHELTFDPEMQRVARSYATQMMLNGFFSHTSQVDGTSPGQRATNAGIDFTVMGENLAFSPDVYLAHQGLMNSEGHRKNILSIDYGRVGIGVIDGGVYGKMFVQEFRN